MAFNKPERGDTGTSGAFNLGLSKPDSAEQVTNLNQALDKVTARIAGFDSELETQSKPPISSGLKATILSIFTSKWDNEDLNKFRSLFAEFERLEPKAFQKTHAPAASERKASTTLEGAKTTVPASLKKATSLGEAVGSLRDKTKAAFDAVVSKLPGIKKPK